MFCARCGAEIVLRQRFCRQCGMLLAGAVDFSLDKRVSQQLAQLRKGDCELGNLALNVRTVTNGLMASLVFLLLLSIRMAVKGQLHLDLFVLIGALSICSWQFRRFRGLFREVLHDRYSVPHLTTADQLLPERFGFESTGSRLCRSPLLSRRRWN